MIIVSCSFVPLMSHLQASLFIGSSSTVTYELCRLADASPHRIAVPALRARSNERRKAKPKRSGVHGPRVQCTKQCRGRRGGRSTHRVESTGVPLANRQQDQGSGIPFRWRQAASGHRPRQGHMQGQRGLRNGSSYSYRTNGR